MTLNHAEVNVMHKVSGIAEGQHKETITALKEVGIFSGASICKICENRAKCAIYQIYGCNKIMLHSDFSQFIEVEKV